MANLPDRWARLRDRLLTSPRFQAWATAFPLTRPVARRRAKALFDLCAGFVYSQILLACVRLQLVEKLAAGPQTAAELAPRLGLSVDASERLLRAAAALRLAKHRGRDGDRQRFGLGDLGAALISNPGVQAMVEHHALLYADLRDPVALLGKDSETGPPSNALASYWPYTDGDPDADQSATYSMLMSVSQPLVAAEILSAYRFANHRCLLDIGGGDGSFLTAVAQRAPKLKLLLFDLPPVAELARARFAEQGLGGRAAAVGGDFRDPNSVLPAGADIVSLVRVLYDHDDATVLTILRTARGALPADGSGVLLVAEPMAGIPGAETVGDAYFGFYLLAMGKGRSRTPTEIERLLRQAGFHQIKQHRTRNPLLTQVITAQPDTVSVTQTNTVLGTAPVQQRSNSAGVAST